MARPQGSDFLHSMRFHVTTVAAGSAVDWLKANRPENTASQVEAGFMSCTTPEATTEAVEYREGTYNYPRKFPGNTTVSDVSLQRGVAKGDSSFWSWLSATIHGGAEYRVDMTISHFDRTALTANVQASNYDGKGSATFAGRTAARSYLLKEAFPIRHKVAADLDASTSDISVMELDVAYEYFDVTEAVTEGT